MKTRESISLFFFRRNKCSPLFRHERKYNFFFPETVFFPLKIRPAKTTATTISVYKSVTQFDTYSEDAPVNFLFQQLSGQILTMDGVKQSDSWLHSSALVVLQVNVSHTATLIHVSRLCVTAGFVTAILPTAREGNTWSLSCEQDEETFSVRESSAECSLQTGRRVELMPIFSSVCVCVCVCLCVCGVCVCVCVVWTPFIITFLHRGLHMGTSSSLHMTVITSASVHRGSLTDHWSISLSINDWLMSCWPTGRLTHLREERRRFFCFLRVTLRVVCSVH